MRTMNKIKTEYISWIILSISFSFMLFVFAPLEMYLTNVMEFWFQAKDLFPVVMVCFLLVSILLLSAGYLLRKTKIFPYIMSAFLCVYIGFYIQGNFIPRNYGVLDGKEINWTEYSHYGIMAIILWGMVFAVCIIFCRNLLHYIYMVSSYAGIIVSLILTITLGILFVQNIHYEKDKNSVVVSQKDMFSLSNKNNFIVMLYDAFDSSFMNAILNSEDGDEYRKILEDFTYYPDAVGGYPTTKASMPFILTGQWYENEKSYTDYVREAYSKTDLYKFLRQNQYSVGVYTEAAFFGGNMDVFKNVEKGAYVLTNVLGFVKDIYKLVGFNYLPHQLKKYIRVYSGDFDQYAKSTFEDEAYSIMDMPEFTALLQKEGISVDENNNAFRFYHLLGTHPYYEFGEDLQKDGKEYTVADEAKGCIQSLKYYCNMLKERGLYDDTVIIVMADHGQDAFVSHNPVFMIKEKQAKGEFQISDIQVSWEDLIPTIKTLISGDQHDGDIWSYDTGTERRRRFLEYVWDGSWAAESLPQMTEYETSGNLKDGTFSLLPTGAVFEYESLDHADE